VPIAEEFTINLEGRPGVRVEAPSMVLGAVACDTKRPWEEC
jgi:hypothetical protein